MSFFKLWQLYQELLVSHPRVFIHLSLALFFASGSFVFISSVVVSKLVKGIDKLRHDILQKKFDHLISEIILSPDVSETHQLAERHSFLIAAYRKKYLRSRYAQNLMIDRMLQLKRSIDGNLEQRIVELFRQLDLQRNSVEKVKSKRWFVVVKGMKEISEMQIKEAHHLLIGKLLSNNSHVVREAQIALVKLSPQNPLYFLDQPKIFLTTWQMLRIHRFIKKNAKAGIPSFQKWLNSSNISVQQFALRMIGLFQQIEAAEQVAGFLNNENVDLRRLAASTLLELEAYHMAETLHEILQANPAYIDAITLRTLAALAVGNEAVDLAFTVLERGDYLLQKEAVATILNAGVSPDKIFAQTENGRKQEVERILLHLNDPLLA